MRPTSRIRGFSLIELLTVLTIVSVFAAIVVLAVTFSRQKARDARRIQDISQVRMALEQYYAVNKSYPFPVGGPFGYCGLTNFLQPYLPTIPRDPLDTGAGCSAASGYEYYFEIGLQPQEYLLRVSGFERPGSLSRVFEGDVDGNAAPQGTTQWIGGTAVNNTYNCPGGTCPLAVQCGVAPENTVATAVYCIRS